ncbi:MAG: hypothetical protein WC528_01315 [Patescibacteria group bacterium]
MEEEKKLENQEFALKGLLEESERLVAAYNETLQGGRDFPEVQATIKENLAMIIGEIEKIDPDKVPVAARDILEGQETSAKP